MMKKKIIQNIFLIIVDQKYFIFNYFIKNLRMSLEDALGCDNFIKSYNIL